MHHIGMIKNILLKNNKHSMDLLFKNSFFKIHSDMYLKNTFKIISSIINTSKLYKFYRKKDLSLLKNSLIKIEEIINNLESYKILFFSKLKSKKFLLSDIPTSYYKNAEKLSDKYLMQSFIIDFLKKKTQQSDANILINKL